MTKVFCNPLAFPWCSAVLSSSVQAGRDGINHIFQVGRDDIYHDDTGTRPVVEPGDRTIGQMEPHQSYHSPRSDQSLRSL